MTVLRGPSGCGKSTLLGAVAGLLPLSGGSVTAAGRPVGGPSWRADIAWLPQRPVFVSGSIADNLRVAAPDADDELLWSALRRVALEERVRDLPGGLDAPVGEDGVTLSAGERARLALARVIVADRPWVLLDEPTAHLDDLTEQVIADTIVELGRTRAVVVVAHRPALLELADHVITLPAAEVDAPREPPAAPSTGPAEHVPRPSTRAPLPVPDPTHPVPPSPGPEHVRRGARLRLRGGAHRDRGLADRAGLHPARRPHDAGGDRRRPHLRPGPARCCGTSSGCGRTTSRCSCWPSDACRSTRPWCR